MSSHDVLGVMRPGGRLVVEGACLEATVQDSEQPVGPLPQGGVMSGPAGLTAGRSRPVRLLGLVSGACSHLFDDSRARACYASTVRRCPTKGRSWAAGCIQRYIAYLA